MTTYHEPSAADERRRHIEGLVVQVESAFLERSDLKLTARAAEVHFDLDPRTCAAILETLVDARVLYKTNDRAYTRLFPRSAAA